MQTDAKTLARACWQWCANGCNNSQEVWDLQYIVGRIQPISLCNPCVMSVRGPNNVGRAVRTDPTLLRYASAIKEQKKCWELLAEKFDRFQTLRNNTQQHPTTCNRVCKRTQHVTSNNVGSVCTGLKTKSIKRSERDWNPEPPDCESNGRSSELAWLDYAACKYIIKKGA